jgi:hypothetical protein
LKVTVSENHSHAPSNTLFSRETGNARPYSPGHDDNAIAFSRSDRCVSFSLGQKSDIPFSSKIQKNLFCWEITIVSFSSGFAGFLGFSAYSHDQKNHMTFSN